GRFSSPFGGGGARGCCGGHAPVCDDPVPVAGARAFPVPQPPLIASGPGWYGKLPALGDFASRRLPPPFIAAWDDWLQRSIAASRRMLGDRWLDRYLQAPVWRFLLGPGGCGDGAGAGVMIPSTDRVGRYFPLTIVAPIPWETSALVRVAAEHDWFETLERAALSVLDVHFSPDDLDAALPAQSPYAAAGLPDDAAVRLGDSLKNWWLAPGNALFDEAL